MKVKYFSKHVPHLALPCRFSVHLTHTALSELCLCPRLAPILSHHNSALAAQAGDAHRDLEMMGLDEIHSILYVLTRTSLFAQSSNTCPTSLGSSPEMFLLFCRMGQGLNTKLTLIMQTQ